MPRIRKVTQKLLPLLDSFSSRKVAIHGDFPERVLGMPAPLVKGSYIKDFCRVITVKGSILC